MFRRRTELLLKTERLYLRPPRLSDHIDWATLRRDGYDYLYPWEPLRAHDHLSLSAFRTRTHWAARAIKAERAVPLFVFRAADGVLLGAITLDNIQRGPAQYATVGYWMGQQFTGHGYMSEALQAVVAHAFGPLDLSRVQAATLPENAASRRVLEKAGFRYEGVAQSFLQIAGKWRTHVVYACLRQDRRGRG
ncbi:GNAT family N-acetyltransferase [Pontivivens nitratireducens]|uniref:GNAT family N-acetyltransferase n=1 Tax=Pontivivens nitratireducens TaxID=2758038 RepID=A0A6G7VHY5_9RHOB|nr:GNAT family protein [Pontibrevibacter nitratireducens]QIK39659.1 GNAT family N-acetyltransferase [Pontibrevibacter nitratireducens]